MPLSAADVAKAKADGGTQWLIDHFNAVTKVLERDLSVERANHVASNSRNEGFIQNIEERLREAVASSSTHDADVEKLKEEVRGHKDAAAGL